MGMALKEFDPATIDLSSPDTFIRSNFVNGVKKMLVRMEATG